MDWFKKAKEEEKKKTIKDVKMSKSIRDKIDALKDHSITLTFSKSNDIYYGISDDGKLWLQIDMTVSPASEKELSRLVQEIAGDFAKENDIEAAPAEDSGVEFYI